MQATEFVRCGEQGKCVLAKGHGGQLHATAVSQQGKRICWAVDGWEDLILAVYGENPFGMSVR